MLQALGAHARRYQCRQRSYSLKAFAQTYNLHFPLLSDFNKKVTKLYGVLQDPWVGLGFKGVAEEVSLLG